MNSLDAIKARAEAVERAEKIPQQLVAMRRSSEGVPRLVAAIEAVLELHSLYVDKNGVNVCDACPYASCESVPYPCDEVRAIHRALEEGKP